MSIALELRQKIYYDVFLHADIKCFSQCDGEYSDAFYGDYNSAKETVEEWSKRRGVAIVPGNELWCFEAAHMHINVLRISRQVACEALPILSRCIHLSVPYLVGNTDVPQTIREHFLPKVEQLTLRSLYLDLPSVDFINVPNLKALTYHDSSSHLAVPKITLEHGSAFEEANSILFGRHDSLCIQLWFDALTDKTTPRPPSLNLLHTLFSSHGRVDRRPRVTIRWKWFLRASLRNRDRVRSRNAWITLEFDFHTRNLLSRSVANFRGTRIVNKTDVAKRLQEDWS